MNKTQDEIYAKIITHLKMRTELQRIVRSGNEAITMLETEIAELSKLTTRRRGIHPTSTSTSRCSRS